MSHVLNRERALRLTAEAGIDVLVATSAQNVFYLTGYRGFVQHLMPATQVYAVVRLDDIDHPTLIAPIGDLDTQAQFPVRLGELRPYGEFFLEPPSDGAVLDEGQDRLRQIAALEMGESAVDTLLQVLGTLPRGARVALDESGMAAAARDQLRSHLGDRCQDGTALLARIRMVKTEEEIRRLEAAALTIEASYLAALEGIQEGVSEAELASILDQRTVEQGSRPAFTVIAFGERAVFPNAVPSPARRLRHGDTIRFDIGCLTELYFSDISRTAAFGDPGQRMRDRYAAILAGEEEMVTRIRAGMLAREVFELAVQTTRRAGIPNYRRNHTGHGVGLDTYDPPLLAPRDNTALEPGMVLEVETPYYEIGFGGLQVEDTVLVTASGCRVLTRTARDLAVIS